MIISVQTIGSQTFTVYADGTVSTVHHHTEAERAEARALLAR